MSVEDRQSMIVDAVIPLLLEHGANITSRQIAEKAGIAEGTIFRAFGDKETLIRAAVQKYFDPQPMRAQLAAISQQDSLRTRIKAAIGILQERFGGVMAMVSALGHKERPPYSRDSSRLEYAGIVAQLVEPELEQLNLPADRVAALLRLVAFSTSIPQFNESTGFTLDELTDIVLFGIVGDPPPTMPTIARPKNRRPADIDNANDEMTARENTARENTARQTNNKDNTCF